jgi:hypothetical protein
MTTGFGVAGRGSFGTSGGSGFGTLGRMIAGALTDGASAFQRASHALRSVSPTYARR